MARKICKKVKEVIAMYKRPDGLYEKVLTINGERLPPFRAKTEREVLKKIAAYKGKVEKGRTFTEVAEEWKGRTLFNY